MEERGQFFEKSIVLVVGSAIHSAKDPAEAADKIVAEIEEGLKARKEEAR